MAHRAASLLFVRMNPDIRRQFTRRVSESSSASSNPHDFRCMPYPDVFEHRMRTVQPYRVGTPLAEPQKPAGQNRGLLPEQGVAGFVESQFCCVEQRMNDQERRLHAEQRSQRQDQRPKVNRNCRCVYPRIRIFRTGTLERNPRGKQSRTERYAGINHSEPASSSSYRPLGDDNRNGALTLPSLLRQIDSPLTTETKPQWSK